MGMRSKTPRLRIPHLAIAAVVVLVLFVLAGFAIAKGTGIRALPGRLDTDVNGTSSTDIEYIPILPGASDIKPEQRINGLWKDVDYKVQMSADDILRWYKVQLASRGWTFEYENRKEPDSPFQGYYWEDKQNKTPYVLRLLVSVNDISSVKQGAPMGVSVELNHLPILDKTPLYLGAQDVEQKQQPVPTPLTTADDSTNNYLMMETVIAYRVQATRQSVEDYYRDILAQYGWSYGGEAFDKSVNAYIKGSLWFRWSMGGVEIPSTGASVTLIANERANGWTEVELHLRGDNKYIPIPTPYP